MMDLWLNFIDEGFIGSQGEEGIIGSQVQKDKCVSVLSRVKAAMSFAKIKHWNNTKIRVVWEEARDWYHVLPDFKYYK